MCNNKEDFTFLYLVVEDDYLIASGNFKKIQAYKIVTITIDIPTGKSKMKLSYVVLIPTFFYKYCSIIKGYRKQYSF